MSKDDNNKKNALDEKSVRFGKNLENILDRLDIRKVDLATGIGVTKGTISNICSGRNYPHLSTMFKIASFLHIDIEELTNCDPKLELITEASQAYSTLQECLISVGALKENETIKKEHIELLEKLIKDNKKLYQEPDKALESAKLIVVPVETLPNND